MLSVLVVVTDLLAHQAFQMAFVENDDMVEQVVAAVTDPSLRDTILPQTPEAASLWLDAEALYCVGHFVIEL